ncbi:Secondary metabolism regulator laeA like protein [Verticillium longisporum]|nr:Secondary metabolism regulator laeA like protein [Verticillium longisporum]
MSAYFSLSMETFGQQSPAPPPDTVPIDSSSSRTASLLVTAPPPSLATEDYGSDFSTGEETVVGEDRFTKNTPAAVVDTIGCSFKSRVLSTLTSMCCFYPQNDADDEPYFQCQGRTTPPQWKLDDLASAHGSSHGFPNQCFWFTRTACSALTKKRKETRQRCISSSRTWTRKDSCPWRPLMSRTYWTDVANANPTATVIGTDVAPIQRTRQPSNAIFYVDDANEPDWAWDGRFDFVHVRGLNSGIKSWTATLRAAASCLHVGGLIEISDMDKMFKVLTDANGLDVDLRPDAPIGDGNLRQGDRNRSINSKSLPESLLCSDLG